MKAPVSQVVKSPLVFVHHGLMARFERLMPRITIDRVVKQSGESGRNGIHPSRTTAEHWFVSAKELL